MAIIEEPLVQAIERLRAQHNDDADYEAKSCATTLSKSVWESVSAFANTDGGTLLLGVDENKNFTVPPQFDADKTINQFVDGMGDGSKDGAKVVSPPPYSIHRDTLDGAQMVSVQVHENDAAHKPCYVKSKSVSTGSYKRQDDKDILLSPTELFEMQNVYKPSEADRAPITDADRGDLDDATVAAIIDAHRDTKALRGAHSEMQQLERLNILDKKGHVRLAGVLIAGAYPQQFFPRLYVDVAVHPGINKSQDGEVRFLDRVQCDGRLQEMVDDAVKAVLRNLRTYSLIEGTGRRDVPEIPTTVLREAIANAVVHREYDALFRNDPVNIDIYSNRVEISSPGGLWGGKTLQNLANGVSRCRNATLMQLLQKTPLIRGDNDGSAVEGQGSGIQFMINRMKELSLAQPDFQPTFDRFRVILYRGGAELAMNQQWVRSHVGHDLPGRESSVLHTVRALGRTSVHDIRDRLGYDSDDIRAMLATLVEAGLIRQVSTDVYEPLETPTIANTGDVPTPPAAALSSRQAIIDAIPTSGTISARDIAESTGKSLPTVRRILHELVDDGTITAIGKKQSRLRTYTRAQTMD
ncbi:transcriptional regulator [Bifidobacterium pseudolongum subsp. globosum]|uniref:ATP-binding protein n=1 Tax=Bifidobacterium pseudolongum TaxID=1694 RepID=UPI0010202F05|nr:ATP-binding protein [Bifidobacterium pseudolongum]RYQ03338.1 transcriptional regulator [Bifidobacterium pseudolongum subsp. globosum]RYQ08017.1 transcriptional regulator [Bifidobacterium pseudolongum subsp. globosum]RYQ11773.1 transcriptional regulator [Bifidobacterium pseudolongum subsp. globosum]RYQ14027.1 transcriptional regulator [Bifidobacterium pseudolongum subsp. globosum]